MFHQKINKLTKQRIIQFIVLILIIISVSYVSFEEYKNTLRRTTSKLNEKMINFHFETFTYLTTVYLKNADKHFVEDIKRDKALRNEFEDMLRIIHISTIQNLFLIARDSDKNYYFLLDSDQNPKTRANIFEPFNPLGEFWNDCYEEKKPKVYHHTKSKNLWITIAYPIVQNNKTVALIGADISHDLNLNMQTKLNSFGSFFVWILFLGFTWFIVLYILTFYFRRKFHEGFTDPLTQIYTRKYLYDILLKKLERNYQLYMVDIDFFKKVNDSYGHDTGDIILKEVARRMSELIREEDSLIRYGGEEFLIYTTKLDLKQSIEFAERLRENIKKEPIIYKDIVCHVSVSIGVNPYARKDRSFNEMLKKADEALYDAKNSGRDCVKIAQ